MQALLQSVFMYRSWAWSALWLQDDQNGAGGLMGLQFMTAKTVKASTTLLDGKYWTYHHV